MFLDKHWLHIWKFMRVESTIINSILIPFDLIMDNPWNRANVFARLLVDSSNFQAKLSSYV